MRTTTLSSISVMTCALLVLAGQSSAEAAQTGTASNAAAADKLSRGLVGNSSDAVSGLAGLAVKPLDSMTGYSRDLFPHWRDASTWGWPVAPNDKCDARNAALYRDGDNVTVPSTCTNLAGSWTDPYGAGIYNSPSDIDIDHMVPLGNAWATGADNWDATTRTKFANDPLVLVSAKDTLNQSKGDKDPSVWKPPNTAAYCLYATRWVLVKKKYALWVTSAEKSSLNSMLGSC